jgi:hypothetical protein
MLRDEFLHEIKDRLLLSLVAMESYEDQKRREVEFEEGDWVWLRLPQRTVVVIVAAHSKINPKYYGHTKFLRSLAWWHISLSSHPMPKFMMSFTSQC